MSLVASDYVWKNSRSTGSARLLMLAIANFADDAGHAWPSRPTLAQYVGVSVRQVSALVAECERLGELAVSAELGGRNHYYITALSGEIEGARPVRPAAERKATAERRRATGVAHRTSAGRFTSAADRTGGSAADRTGGSAADRTGVVQPTAQNPSINGQKNNRHPEPSGTPPPVNAFTMYEALFGELTKSVCDTLLMLVQDYTDAEVIEALKITQQRGKDTLDYTRGVLKKRAASGEAAEAKRRAELNALFVQPSDDFAAWDTDAPTESPDDEAATPPPAPGAATPEAEAWDTAYAQLKLQLDGDKFETWVRDTRFLRYEAGQFVIGVRNSFTRDMLQHRLYRNVARILSNAWGQDASIVFEVEPGEVSGAASLPLFQRLAAAGGAA